jgi:hypothetical protein
MKPNFEFPAQARDDTRIVAMGCADQSSAPSSPKLESEHQSNNENQEKMLKTNDGMFNHADVELMNNNNNKSDSRGDDIYSRSYMSVLLRQNAVSNEYKLYESSDRTIVS